MVLAWLIILSRGRTKMPKLRMNTQNELIKLLPDETEILQFRRLCSLREADVFFTKKETRHRSRANRESEHSAQSSACGK